MESDYKINSTLSAGKAQEIALSILEKWNIQDQEK